MLFRIGEVVVDSLEQRSGESIYLFILVKKIMRLFKMCVIILEFDERNFMQCTYATTYLHMETVFPKRCYVGEQIVDIAENKFSFSHRQNFFDRFCGLETL